MMGKILLFSKATWRENTGFRKIPVIGTVDLVKDARQNRLPKSK